MVRTGKILLAVYLLMVGLGEAYQMWIHSEDLLSLAFVLFLLGVPVFFLLRSAFRPPTLPSRRGWRIFWTIIAVLCVLGMVGLVLQLGRPG